MPRYALQKNINLIIFEYLRSFDPVEKGLDELEKIKGLRVEEIIYYCFLKQWEHEGVEVVERKLGEVVEGVIEYGDVERVRLFGRFLNLWGEREPLGVEDWLVFILCIKNADDTGMQG